MKNQEKTKPLSRLSLSAIFTVLVSAIVLITSIVTVLMFIGVYRDEVEQNAVTSSEQAVSQVESMVQSYIYDMETVMDTIVDALEGPDQDYARFLQSLVEIREDVVAVMIYDENGEILELWSNGQTLKDPFYQNLSYTELPNDSLHVSKPHVETLFEGYYPWVVTISQNLTDHSGSRYQAAVDIRFSSISNYVDNVGSDLTDTVISKTPAGTSFTIPSSS